MTKWRQAIKEYDTKCNSGMPHTILQLFLYGNSPYKDMLVQIFIMDESQYHMRMYEI